MTPLIRISQMDLDINPYKKTGPRYVSLLVLQTMLTENLLTATETQQT